MKMCDSCGEKRVYAQRRCHACYAQAMKAGEIQARQTRRRRSLKDRLIAKVTVDGSGCWIVSSTLRNGYAVIRDENGKLRSAHRASYELFVGPIPSGLELDHLCRVRQCSNPAHLEPVTRRINALRGVSFSAVNAAKTHCVNGHEFTPENTYYRTPTHRQCRACGREYTAAYLKRKSMKEAS